MSAIIRIRRLPAKGLFRRKRYEIQIPAGAGESIAREETTTPVTRLDKYLGVGDAWTLVHAADQAWDGSSGSWVTLQTGQ